jgi:hypothetical protein
MDAQNDVTTNGEPGPSIQRKRKLSATTLESLQDRQASLSIEPGTDDDSPARGTKEQKRTRVHFSCVECHRRKQKCDRKEPCSQCVTRRVPHLCRPFLNGVEDTAS